MITIDQSEFLQQLKSVADLASKNRETHFLSYITKIHGPEILTVYKNGGKVGFNHRTFWSDGEGLTLVGIGNAFEYSLNESDRFNKTKEVWSGISKRVVKNLDKKGTGPLMLGGFSFSNTKNDSNEWEHFPESAFVIPRFLFTESDGQMWLTVNIDVTPNMDCEKVYELFTDNIQQLIDTAPYDSGLPKIVNIETDGRQEWLDSVKEVTNRIREERVEKVVLSRALNVHLDDALSSETLLEKLLDRRTYGFVFAFERNGDCFVGATPERLVKRDGQLVFCDCLAGTEARGRTPEEDKAIGGELLNDAKNLAEHQFVVQMIKNAMRNFAKDVMAPEHPRLVKAESVQHLYTPVSGWLKEGITLFDAISQLHPTPAMGGTPRETALSIINELEHHDRGWYAAPIGWVDDEGNGDFAVGIRSCLIQGSTVRLFAGCGIVQDSVPEKEYRETNLKFRPILNALEAPPYE